MKLQIIEFEKIISDESQARKFFDEKSLESLKQSIIEKGLLQPIVVREYENQYMIVAGERRFRAITKIFENAKNATENQCLQKIAETFKEITVTIIDKDYEEISLIENVQREELTHVELAEGLQKLKQNAKVSQEHIATIIGKSSSTVSEILSINNILQEIRDEAREQKDLSLWILVEVAKKQGKSQTKLWNTLKNGDISQSSYRKEKNKKAMDSPKRISINNFNKIIKTTATQIKTIIGNDWDDFRDTDKSLIQETIKNLMVNLQEIEKRLKSNEQCSKANDQE